MFKDFFYTKKQWQYEKWNMWFDFVLYIIYCPSFENMEVWLHDKLNDNIIDLDNGDIMELCHNYYDCKNDCKIKNNDNDDDEKGNHAFGKLLDHNNPKNRNNDDLSDYKEKHKTQNHVFEKVTVNRDNNKTKKFNK